MASALDSRPDRVGGRRSTVRVLLGIVLLLLAAEALLKSPLARSRLLLPTHHYQDGVALRQLALDDILRDQGQVDVLFVGSSIVRTNIRPLIFDEIVGSGGAGIVSFNGGLSGLMPDAIRFYVEHFWLDRARPTMVVQGIRYDELADVRSAADHDRLMGGTIEPLWLSARPADRARATAIENVKLLQYRGWLAAALDRRRGGRAIDARGYTPTGLALEDAIEEGLIDSAEAYTGEERFDVGATFIRRIHALCEQRGVRYVLLNIPEHPDRFPERDGDAIYGTYLDTLRSLAAEEGFVFIDPSNGDLGAFDIEGTFSDFHHMTPEGAAALTHEIAMPIAELIPEPAGEASAGAPPSGD